MSRICLVLACALSVSGCATQRTLDLASQAGEAQDAAAIFWPHSRYNGWIHGYPDNHLFTTRLDEMAVARNVAYIRVSPGPHAIEVLHERRRLCTWELIGRAFGYYHCFQTEGTTQMAWEAEAGHSYMPFAVHRCERNWYWIEDTGESGSDDIQIVNTSPYRLEPRVALADDVRKRSNEAKKVVAGTAPPDECPAPPDAR